MNTQDRSIVLINLSGHDRPGITSAITEILAGYGVNILDIGQAVIHDTLALGLLAHLPPQAQHSPVLQELLFKAHEWGMQIRFTPVAEASYEHWVAGQGKGRYIVTLLGRRITAEQIARVTRTVAENGLNIDRIHRLSGRVSMSRLAEPGRACVEFSVRGDTLDTAELRRHFLALAGELEVDIAVQEDNIYRRNRRLVVFDMDSTLIEAEVIDELAKEAGVGEQVAEITERAMCGELDFNESFKARVALLKGLDASVLEKIAQRLPITEGAEKLVSTLKRLGYRTAILSGGFTYFGEYLQQKLGIDEVHANLLEVEDGKVTGRVVGRVVDGQRKAELLQEIARNEGINLEQAIAVGDGANDLPMLGLAGLGIAFRAKPLVRQNARHALSTLGLDAILYLIGFSDRDIDQELHHNN
ncbi:phosphoserine phosphatase SerB [Marinospirillum alkaliphilum]|uniref:Phosphoserine phosphatase n=1 Tax=Marinospirillum alkaliphilum DSM 21637 TaxID=1122209 RepID=A0A1K1YDN3_9GAMM|nr:phosphoserine phosphatase SerB [Marinospirillum alkaliphilum]SFX60130.1 phosphoserine phosphatase [Marinospirillum alkaliphilum DSM 21637]